MKFLYKFASRGRPHKFFNCIENIISLSENNDYIIQATLDENDTLMKNRKIMERMDSYEKLKYVFGESKTKIEAYNRDMDLIPQWDILINMSDDMVFTKQGYDIEIEKDMIENFPDLDGLLHYNDNNQRDNVITLAIMGRKYYDRFGFVYHPSYTSLWCDNEQMEVAKLLGRYKYMGHSKILFRHEHPAWGYPGMDELYIRNESRLNWVKDESNYQERKKINFGI